MIRGQMVEDLQNDLLCYRVFNTGQDGATKAIGVSRGGEVGGRSRPLAMVVPNKQSSHCETSSTKYRHG